MQKKPVENGAKKVKVDLHQTFLVKTIIKDQFYQKLMKKKNQIRINQKNKKIIAWRKKLLIKINSQWLSIWSS